MTNSLQISPHIYKHCIHVNNASQFTSVNEEKRLVDEKLIKSIKIQLNSYVFVWSNTISIYSTYLINHLWEHQL